MDVQPTRQHNLSVGRYRIKNIRKIKFRMFCRACEFPAAVYNIGNGQTNRSAMETAALCMNPLLHTSLRCPLYQVHVSMLDYGGDHRH